MPASGMSTPVTPAGAPAASRHWQRGSAGGDKVRRVGVQLPAATLLAHHHVLDAYSDPSLPDDGRLVCERHPDFEKSVLLLGDEGPLVHVEADAVAHPMPEVRSVAGLFDGRTARAVDLGAGHTRSRRRAAGLLRCQHRCVRPYVFGGRLPAQDGATEVRAVAVEHGAKVKQDRLAFPKGPACTRTA